jgi:hypothetical protein
MKAAKERCHVVRMMAVAVLESDNNKIKAWLRHTECYRTSQNESAS